METSGCGEIPERLREVHYTPEFPTNLLSVRQLMEEGMEVHFTRDKKVALLDKNDNVVAVSERSSDKSYSLRIKDNKQSRNISKTLLSKSDEIIDGMRDYDDSINS